jgi:hypothetical protein
MRSWQKTCIALMMALFAGLASTTFAAATARTAGSPGFSAAGTPSQSQDAPPDCKKKPDDPRCKKKPY